MAKNIIILDIVSNASTPSNNLASQTCSIHASGSGYSGYVHMFPKHKNRLKKWKINTIYSVLFCRRKQVIQIQHWQVTFHINYRIKTIKLTYNETKMVVIKHDNKEVE